MPGLRASATEGATIEKTAEGYLLKLEGGDARRYRNAQLDDYAGLPRSRFPHRSISLRLRARVSGASLAGTWGFGLWNNPFGLSLGFGGSPLRLPALPNAAWFFHASPQNYLSFQDDKAGNGFLAQTFKSPKFHARLAAAGAALPFSPKTARRLLSRVIAEDGFRLSANPLEWRSYRLDWYPTRVVFWVDETPVFESHVSPNPPLGVVVWIDNQFAAFTPQGKLAAGVLPNAASWLEVKDLAAREENN